MPLDLKPILTGVGLDAAYVDQLLATPEDKLGEVKPDEILAKINTGYQTKLRNDPDFIAGLDESILPEKITKSIEAKQYGRAANIVRQNILKTFGMTEADFADLGDEGKKVEVFVKKAAEKYMNGKSSDTELQKQLIDARKALEDLQTDTPVKMTELENKYKGEMNEKMMEFIVLAQLSGVKNLKVPAGYVNDKVLAKLKSQYNLVVEGMDAKLKQKNNPALDALDGTEILTLQKAIEKILVTDNLIGEEVDDKKKKESGSVTLDVDGTGTGLKVSSHIAKAMQKNIELEKKSA